MNRVEKEVKIEGKSRVFFTTYINHGLSIITSKVRQIISVMKTTGVSREIIFQKYVVHFGILIHVLY